jgi:quercetin dioxygenase-like cupin family protein
MEIFIGWIVPINIFTMRIKNLKKFNEKDWTWVPQYAYPQDEYYTNDNTEFYQSFDEAPSEIIKFADKHFQKNYSITMIKQPPASFIPRHKDKHYRFRSTNKKQNAKKIVRYCIFLQDWKPGQYFEYDDKPVAPWSKGDVIVLEPGVYHRSGNCGTQFKYTLQITGLLN